MLVVRRLHLEKKKSDLESFFSDRDGQGRGSRFYLLRKVYFLKLEKGRERERGRPSVQAVPPWRMTYDAAG